jgi:hypothetical protein
MVAPEATFWPPHTNECGKLEFLLAGWEVTNYNH